MPAKPVDDLQPLASPAKRALPAALLVLATLVTTTVAGALDAVSGSVLDLWHAPALLARGLPYATAVLSILFVRELACVAVLRKSGDRESLPYFFPAPTLFGTLGTLFVASPKRHTRKEIFDAAAASSLTGMFLSLVLAIIGIGKSDPIDPGAPASGSLGSSLVFKALVAVLRPEAIDGLTLHPLAFAGWCGLFITAANLVPVGQLDGGHLVYGIFGPRQRWVSWAAMAVLFGLGVGLGGHMWVIWPLVLGIMGVGHPSLRDEAQPLGGTRKALAVVMLVVLIATFPLVPVAFVRP